MHRLLCAATFVLALPAFADDMVFGVVLFQATEVFTFCSVALSRKVIEADVMNVRFCPYDIFVMQQPGSD